MKVKLIQAKMHKRPMDTDLKLRMAPHLGLLTIANIIRYDCEVTIENENIREIDFEDLPDLVGITVTVDVLPRAMEIAKEYRKRGVKVVAGGIHVTSAFNSIPENAFDVLCIGMAETTWPEIINDFKNSSLKSKYFSKASISSSEIISPAYDMIDEKDYLYCNIVNTSRGCPFSCDFCYNSSGHHTYINREIDDVIEDIKTLKTKHIMFIDDNFIGNKKWTREFLEKIKPMNLKWNAAVTANLGKDLDLMDLMAESGCRSLFIGFESINPKSITSVHKVQNNIGDYEDLISELHKRGIMINGSFVFGLDGDSEEIFKATRDWIVDQKIETITSHILTPYPGTRFHSDMEREKRITNKDLEKYNTANVVFKPIGMSPEDLYNGYLWIYKDLYSFKNIIKRIPKTKSQILPYLTFNFFYRKFGKFTEFFCNLVSFERIGFIAQRVSRYL